MAADPVAAVAGFKPLAVKMEGAGTPVTVNGTRLDTTPGAFCTSMKAEPAVRTRLAGISAVTWVELTYAVVSGVVTPPASHCTTEVGTKFDPVTPIVKEGCPAVMLACVRPLLVLICGGCAP